MNIFAILLYWFAKEKDPAYEPLVWGRRGFLGEYLEWLQDRLSYGFCIVGGIGVGKSRRLILAFLAMMFYRRLWQGLDEEWAGLIIDPKLTLVSNLLDLHPRFTRAALVKCLYVLGEDNDCPINILRSPISSERLAELLSESRYAGKKLVESSASNWFESNAITGLGLLIALARLTREKCMETVFKMFAVLVKGGTLTGVHPKAGPLLARLDELLAGKPDEVRQILASIGNILKPFRDDPWRKIFSKEGDYFLETARDQGKIMLTRISPNTSGYQSGLFLLKALWFETIMERLDPKFRGNKKRLCFYVCDEFQKVARPGSESKFFDVRREANAVPIVAFQQLSQLEDVLGKTEANSVLGMLSVKVALRNSDPETNEYFSWLSGEVDRIDESKTTPSSPTSWEGSSTTESRVRLPRIHSNFFMELPDGDGVVFETGKKPITAWFGDALLLPEQEKAWRKKFWPTRPKLSKPPRYLR